jgi:hypothetical protein
MTRRGKTKRIPAWDPAGQGCLKLWIDRGRDGVVSATPPSEPDGRISRVRLTSQWGLGETNHKRKSHVPD